MGAGLTPAGLGAAGLGGSGPPTISAVTPALVHTGGGTLVEITGTNFRVPVIPPPGGGVAAPVGPTVQVTFGGEAAQFVGVINSTRLIVRVPQSPLPLTPPAYGEGSVDVVVTNLDPDGLPIAGESVTLVDGLTYERPQLANESIVTRVTRQLVLWMRQQVLPNVTTTTHTDYDEDPSDGLNITELAQLPGIALIGPDLEENRFFSLNQQPVVDTLTGVQVRQVPYTVDMAFSVLGVSDNQQELLNMMTVVQQFFHRNKYLRLLRDATDPNSGEVSYEMEVVEGGDMRTFGAPNTSNIRTFSGTIVVRGVDLEDIEGFPGQQVSDTVDTFPADGDVNLSTEQIGASFNVGPSPGDC